MDSILVQSHTREEMLDITRDVAAVIPDGNGICILFVQHTTCGLTVNENADPDVKSDMLGFLRRLIPQLPPPRPRKASGTPPQAGGEFFFKHSEGNSDAHIKSSLVGSSVTVPFENGKLCLGRWQGIYLCEFDGPRERTVLITFV